MEAEEILKESTLHTFQINEGSPLHEAVIKAMKDYAKQFAQESLNKAYQESLIDTDLHSFCACEVDEESIIKESNIVLL